MVCGKVQTAILKLPGKQANVPSGWNVQAKLTLYIWLGILKHKQYFFSGLPKGFDMSQELRNAERVGALAPSNIHYLEKHVIAKFFLVHLQLKLLMIADVSIAGTHLSG